MAVLLDKSIEFEGISAAGLARLEPLSWSDASPLSAATAVIDLPLLRAELVVVDRSGHSRARLPVSFDQRIARGTSVSLLGSDRGGSLKVSVETGGPQSDGRMRFSFRPDPAATPRSVRDVITWFEALSSDRQLGLWMADRDRWGIRPGPISASPPRLPRDYVRAARVLARIEDRTGTTFPMPAEFDEDTAEAIDIADRLLRGVAIVGRWSGATIEADGDLRAFLGDSEHGVMLEYTATHRLQLGGHEITIGEVDYRLLHARMAPGQAGEGMIRLIPGSSDRAELRLIGVPEVERLDGVTSWVPAAMLEPHVGRWVAQSGTRVIASGDTFADAAEKARASGRLATIWRVPATTEQAEALSAF